VNSWVSCCWPSPLCPPTSFSTSLQGDPDWQSVASAGPHPTGITHWCGPQAEIRQPDFAYIHVNNSPRGRDTMVEKRPAPDGSDAGRFVTMGKGVEDDDVLGPDRALFQSSGVCRQVRGSPNGGIDSYAPILPSPVHTSWHHAPIRGSQPDHSDLIQEAATGQVR
jgi:hypothetical protein